MVHCQEFFLFGFRKRLINVLKIASKRYMRKKFISNTFDVLVTLVSGYSNLELHLYHEVNAREFV